MDGVYCKLWDVSFARNPSDNSLCAIAVARACLLWFVGHSFRPHWLSCQCTHKTHAVAKTPILSHSDMSHVQLTHANTHAPSLCIHQFINCRESYTREGQLKMHWELEKRNVSWVQFSGETQAAIQKTERQGKQRDTGRETDRRHVKLPLRGFVLVPETLTAPYGHTPLHTQRNRHKHTVVWFSCSSCTGLCLCKSLKVGIVCTHVV